VKSLSVSNCSPWQINLQSQNLPLVAVDTSYASPFLVALGRFPDPTALVLPLIANAQSRCEGWWHLCSYLCNMGQTRVFAASIMMLTERVVRTCFYNWRVDMGITGKPGKESNKATLARIKKEMAQPRIVKSARKGASTRHDSQRPRHDRLSPQLLP